MRVLTIAIVAAFLALPATVPAQACEAGMHSATADYSAAKKKSKKQKKQKEEYMRAAPMK
jgi:hypothetical protein